MFDQATFDAVFAACIARGMSPDAAGASASAAAVQAGIAKAASAAPVATGPTFGDVLRDYLDWTDGRPDEDISPATKRHYRNVLTRIIEHGPNTVSTVKGRKMKSPGWAIASRPVSDLDTNELQRLLRQESAGSQRDVLKRLRGFYRYAIKRGAARFDPTADISAPKFATKRNPDTEKGHHTWTDAEIAQYRAHFPLGSRERLGFELAIECGQRRTDLVFLRWEHIRDGRDGRGFYFQQHKTKQDMFLPISRDLEAALAAHTGTRTGCIIKHGKGSRGIQPKGFGNLFAKWCDAAGLPDWCVLHGLRKAFAKDAFEKTGSADLAMRLTGHKSREIFDHYAAQADQAMLAARAMALKDGKLQRPAPALTVIKAA